MKHVLFASFMMMLLVFSSAFSPAMPPGDDIHIIDQAGETIQMDTSNDITVPVNVELAAEYAVPLLSEGVFSVYDSKGLSEDLYLMPPDISDVITLSEASYFSTAFANSSADIMQNSSIYAEYGLRYRYS